MRPCLRALNASLVAALAAAVVTGTWLLVASAPETVRVSPALLTSAAPALLAVMAGALLRSPLGELARASPRTGFGQTCLAAATIWILGTAAISAAAATVGHQALALSVLRGNIGFAALAVLGAVLWGPNGATGLVFGWLTCTAMISANADQASWMWNMPVTGTSPWVAVGLIATAAGAIAAAWLRRSDRAYLHSRA